MPGTEDTDDQLNESEEQTEDIEETVGSTEESTDNPKDEKADKRIRDLQSKADAAEARANKAEAALKVASADKGSGGESRDPAQQALMLELREASLDAMYAEFPVLKQYGIDRSLIEGSTRAEMRDSATTVVGLIKSVTTKVRNETLAEHGLSAPASGAARKPPVDYANMDDEAFKKLLDQMN